MRVHVLRKEKHMANAPSGIEVHQDSEGLAFRVSGRASMHQCAALLKVAEESRAAGVKTLSVDLRDCVHMDSTFLGTLLRLKREMFTSEEQFALVAPSTECTKLLHQMGMDRLLPVVDGASPQGDWRQLEDKNADPKSAFQETVVRAHQELANLSGSGGDQFRALATKLAKAWEAEKQQRPAN
jgi:anti-anti-sigma factor